MPAAKLVGKQLASVRAATARGNLWEGAVRSSKTVSSTIAWLDYVRHGPRGALLMTGKTERTLKRNIIDPIQEMVGARRCVYRIGSGELDLFGRTIYTAGANDERAADKIKGMTLAGAYCDEVTTYPQSFFAMLGTRLSIPGARWYGTTNPEGPAHWLHKEQIERAQLRITRDGRTVRSTDPDALDLNVFTFQLADNPHLAADYVASLKREYVGLFYRRYVLGEWCLAEGVVYDMFDPEQHVVTELPEIHRYWLGVDYGTQNPFAAVLVGLGVDGILYVVAEWRHDGRATRRQMTDAQYSEAIRAWLRDLGIRPEWSFVDPSAASFITQAFQDGGLPNLARARNEVLDGIRSVAAAMGAGRLRVHASCTGLLDEVSAYSWDPSASDNGEDKPLKRDDHSLDALRYALHSTAHEWRHLLTLTA
jgi:PBSX family phage terminase large subunit